MPRPPRSRPPFAAVIPAFASLAGCASAVDLEGEDDSAFLPTARVSFDLVRWDRARGGDAPEADARGRDVVDTAPARTLRPGGLSVDLVASNASGEFDQSLASGESVVVGGDAILGPELVRAAVDLYELGGRARVGQEFGAGFGVESTLGFSYYRLDVEASGGGTTLEDTNEGIAVVGGFALTQTPLDWLQLRAGVELALGAAAADEFQVTTWDVGAVVEPVRHVRLIGGWRLVDLDLEGGDDSGFDDSGVEVEISGLWVGVWLAF